LRDAHEFISLTRRGPPLLRMRSAPIREKSGQTMWREGGGKHVVGAKLASRREATLLAVSHGNVSVIFR